MNALIGLGAASIMLMMLIVYWVYSNYIVYLRPGYVRARIRCKDRRLLSMYTPFNVNTNKFKFRNKPYLIDPNCIEREGLMRIPTLLYIEGVSNPLFLGDEKITLGGISANDFHDALESHVGRDLIRAFADDGISIMQSVLIIVIVMGIGFAALFYMQHKNQESLMKQINVATGYQAPVTPPVDTVPGVTTKGE